MVISGFRIRRSAHFEGRFRVEKCLLHESAPGLNVVP
jgi:hypothetical protein